MNKFENKSIDELKTIRKELVKDYAKARGERELYLRKTIREIENKIKEMENK